MPTPDNPRQSELLASLRRDVATMTRAQCRVALDMLPDLRKALTRRIRALDAPVHIRARSARQGIV
jgi:hypothetical protein